MKLDWLTAAPIAHRGLHDAATGVLENTPAAVSRALDAGFSVEIDVRETADGEAVVFHDATLERLTGRKGRVSESTLAELSKLELLGSTDRFWTLAECLELVAGRGALVIEIKAPWRKDPDFARRVAEQVAGRGEPIAVKSFNPRAIAAVREVAPKLARGIIGEAFADDDPAWKHLTTRQRANARDVKHRKKTKPHFLSWDMNDLPRTAVAEARERGLPVLTWTVTNPEEQTRALAYADQIVFEGFTPAAAGAPGAEDAQERTA